MLYFLHELERFFPVFIEDFTEAGKECLGKRVQGKCLDEACYSFRDGIEPCHGVVGQEAYGKNTGCRISVDRDDGDENIPAGFKLLFQAVVAGVCEGHSEFSKDDPLAPYAGYERDARI